MDCKFIKELDVLAYTFNPDRTSIFYLVEKEFRLHLIYENLLTSMLLNNFEVPLKESRSQNHHMLAYNRKHKLLVLAVASRLLVYGVIGSYRGLLYQTEAHGKNAYLITSITTADNSSIVFFSAVYQRNVYCLNLEDCLQQQPNTQPNFMKLRVKKEVEIGEIKCNYNRLVACCSDGALRIWNTSSLTDLKGMVIEPSFGSVTTLAFSKDGGKLLAGTDRGNLYVWDGRSLGSNNTLILLQKLTDKRIISVCWFHYSGYSQSRRLIVMTADGSIRLYSYSLKKYDDKRGALVGVAMELCSLFKVKVDLSPFSSIHTHSYSNHVFFSPGRLLYLVDYQPSLYYPVYQQQLTHSFEMLTPDAKNEIFWQRYLFFIEGLDIKKLSQNVEKKLSLNSVLDQEGLKILKMYTRPLSLYPTNKCKFLINYYFGMLSRALLIYRVDLSQTSDNIGSYKYYQCNMCMFLGPLDATDPLIFLLNDDKQTITILLDYEKYDRERILSKMQKEERDVFSMPPGELLLLDLKIKIQKVYRTPFRSGYAVLYRSDNLLRYSRNRSEYFSLMDYEVLNQPQLRIDYSNIIIDVVWCNSSTEIIGAIVCLDRVMLINASLKVIRSVEIAGYVVQAQWQGYSLLVTTKMSVLAINLYGYLTTLFSLESQEDKTLVAMILADRLITISRSNQRKKDKQVLDIRTRMFNMMEILISGYLAFSNVMCIPFDLPIIKKTITALVPYTKVSELFLSQLNSNKLMNYSNYFLTSNPKAYSIDIKVYTFCAYIGLRILVKALWPNQNIRYKEFWRPTIHRNKKKSLLLLYQYCEVCRDSEEVTGTPDEYLDQLARSGVEIPKTSLVKLKDECLASLYNKVKVVVSVNFGEKTLSQLYRDERAGEIVNMAIESFQAEEVGQWIGLFSTFVEAKQSEGANQQDYQKDDFFYYPEGYFNDLIAYYRFDYGKGDTVYDLSDYTNNAVIVNPEEDMWNLLYDEPLEVEDKWGKKCPPQYSIKVNKKHFVYRHKDINYKPSTKFTLEIWVKLHSPYGYILSFGDSTRLFVKYSRLTLILYGKEVQFVAQPQYNESEQPKYPIINSNWNHISLLYYKYITKVNLILNCQYVYEANFPYEFKMPFSKALRLGSDTFDGELTEFRLWKNKLSVEEIKDCFRSPLSIVSEKRKKLKMKIKKVSNRDMEPISLELPPGLPGAEKTLQPPPAMDWGIPF